MGAVAAAWHRCCGRGSAATRSGYGVVLLAQASATIAEPHLDASLGQIGALSQLLAREDVRVLRALKGALQLLQLGSREGGTAATLFAFQCNARFAFTVGDLVVGGFVVRGI